MPAPDNDSRTGLAAYKINYRNSLFDLQFLREHGHAAVRPDDAGFGFPTLRMPSRIPLHGMGTRELSRTPRRFSCPVIKLFLNLGRLPAPAAACNGFIWSFFTSPLRRHLERPWILMNL